jgi:hypothetical protein
LPSVVHGRLALPRVRPPMSRILAGNPTGGPQALPLPKAVRLALTTDRRQDLAGGGLDGRPAPPRGLLLPPTGPHIVAFGVIDTTEHGLDVVRGPGVEEGGGHSVAHGSFFCNAVRPGRGLRCPPRAGSRPPLAWRRSARPGCVRWGQRPGEAGARRHDGGAPARGGPRDRGGPLAVWPRGGTCALCHDTPRTGRRPLAPPRTRGRSWPTVQEQSTSTT